MKIETPCVFLIDCEQATLSLWGEILTAAGHRIESCAQPEKLLPRLTLHDRGCFVVNFLMPCFNGLEFLRALRPLGVRMPVIYMSSHADVPSAVRAMKAGAYDFLVPPVEPQDLCEVVARAIEKDREVSRKRNIRIHARTLWAALSPREREVCRLLARGLADKQIAAELGTAPPTVQAQRMKAFQKLHVASAAELVELLVHAADSE